MGEPEPSRDEEADDTVLSRRVESPGIAARLVPLAFMAAVAVVVGGLLYLTLPAGRRLVDNDLLIFLITGVGLAVAQRSWKVVWPDDPRDSLRRDEWQ